MRTFGAALLIVGFFIIDEAKSTSREIQAWFERKDYSVEAAVRALVVAYFASGKAELGRCVHDQYFGSPLAQRRVLSAAWLVPAGETSRALLATMNRLCSGSLPLRQSEHELWTRTGADAVLLELKDARVASAEDAASMLEDLSNEKGQKGLAACIGRLSWTALCKGLPGRSKRRRLQSWFTISCASNVA